MIINFSLTSIDKEHLLTNDGEQQSITSQQGVDFSKLIVNKPWGYEYLVYSNPNVEVWSLFIKKLASTSTHCHPNKKTSLIVLDGTAIFSTLNEEVKLNGLDTIVMEPGVFHTTQAISEEGIHLLEIETPPNKYDLIRLQDRYGRVKSGYEGPNLMSPDEKDCLRFFDYPEGNPVEKEHCSKRICIQNIDTNQLNACDIKNQEIIVVIDCESNDNSNMPVAIGDVYKGYNFLKKIVGYASTPHLIKLMCVNPKN